MGDIADIIAGDILENGDFRPEESDAAPYERSKAGEPCPVCGASLVARLNRSIGVYFLGCSAFPKCTFTR